MKRALLDFINSILRIFKVKLVRSKAGDFDMWAAVKRISSHNFPVNTVIDIGASNGSWTTRAMRIYPQASYLAIEPLQEQEPALIKLKQKHRNFDYALCVAGDTDHGQAKLNVTDDLDGSSVDSTGGESRIVKVMTLDGLVSEKGLNGPFLLKFDTHGYEVPILEGARMTLENTSVIIMEVYNFKITEHTLRFHEMCSFLETLGFRAYDIASPVLRLHDRAFWQMDILFCRKNAEIFSHHKYRSNSNPVK
jgi:FkbM family methyltransferase